LPAVTLRIDREAILGDEDRRGLVAALESELAARELDVTRSGETP
jgi:hypothetical protein